MTYRCIAIDDEPLALDIIEDYVSKIDYLELAGRYTSAVKAVSALRESAADILFLDIQMPELSGFELLDSLQQKPKVIFTTAYDSYAVKSYSINAVDYLLKPFPFARFLQAVERAVSQEQPAVVETVPAPPPEPDYIFVASGGKISRVPISSILFVRGLSDYIEIITTDKRYVVYETLKHLLEQLDSDDFFRIHKSYIVSIGKVDSIENSSLYIGKESIPIGRSYRKSFMDTIHRRTVGR